VIDSNPYRSPETAGDAAKRSSPLSLWLWSACSLANSLLSLLFFHFYGQWHWHRGPWEHTLPGQLGLTWLTAVGGAKQCSVLLALVSCVITVSIFQKKGYLQGIVASPTCILSLMTVVVVT
jgi:hypothetical protein